MMKRRCIEIEDDDVILQWELQQQKGAFTGDTEFAMFLLNIMESRFDHQQLQPTLIDQGIQCDITLAESSAELQEHVKDEEGSAPFPSEFDDGLAISSFQSAPGSPDISDLQLLSNLRFPDDIIHVLSADGYDSCSAALLPETSTVNGQIMVQVESREKLLNDSRIIEMLSLCKPLSIVLEDCSNFIPNFGYLYEIPNIKSEPASPARLNNPELAELGDDLDYNWWSQHVGMNAGAVTVDSELVKREDDPVDNAIEDFGTTDLIVDGQAPAVKSKTGRKRKYKDLTCTVCGKTMPTKKALYAHTQRTHSEKKLRCAKCPKMFFTKYELKVHLDIHKETKAYKCDVCSNEFFHKDSLRRHMLRHGTNKQPVREKNVSCPKCPKMFFSKSKLYVHLVVHKGIKEYKCDLCSKEYYHKLDLDRHKLRHGERNWKCDICDRAFYEKAALAGHKEVNHSGDQPFKCVRKAKYTDSTCLVCGKTMSSILSLYYHMRYHGEKKISCPKCPKMFLKKCFLKRHINKHDNNREYKCDECSADFCYKDSLRRHKLRRHGARERSWKCDMCDKAFYEKTTMDSHKKNTHCDKRPFKCDMCEMAFKSKFHLGVHVALHKQRFQCDLCGDCFERKRVLNRHKMKKHNT